MGRKQCGKRRNCSLRAISPFPTVFSKGFWKEFADDNFKFDENGRKSSKWVENSVGKGEIACYEQFLLFPVFSKGLLLRGVTRCHCVGMG